MKEEILSLLRYKDDNLFLGNIFVGQIYMSTDNMWNMCYPTYTRGEFLHLGKEYSKGHAELLLKEYIMKKIFREV